MPSARTAPTMGSLSRVPHPARLSACDAALTRRASVALRCAAAGASAARARTDHRQARPRRHPLFLALEVVVEVVHLPLDAVRILHPELVLVGVAAVDAHLLLLEKARPSQDVEVMGQGRPRDLDGLLDLSHRHLSARLHEKKKDL